jgi:hypothetical protein
MAETVICSMSVLLKLKPLSKSTHIKQNKIEMAERNKDYHMHINISLIRYHRSMARTICFKRWRKEIIKCVCLLNHSTNSKPKTWLPIDVSNEPINHLCVKHFKMYQAWIVKRVLKREIKSLKRNEAMN